MPQVDAPASAPSAPDAAVLSLQPPRNALGASREQAAPIAALASGPYRVAFGCSLEPAARKEEREGR